MRESTNKVKVRISIQTAPQGKQKVISINAHPQQDNACENIHNTLSRGRTHARSCTRSLSGRGTCMKTLDNELICLHH